MRRLTLSSLVATTLLTFTLTLVGCGGSEKATGLATGALVVTVSTTGKDLDPDGYLVSVDGGQGIAIGVNATDTLTGLSGGYHDVQLTDVRTNCYDSHTLEHEAAVTAGNIATTTFDVTCNLAFIDQIAFATDRDGQEEIYVMGSDGSHPINMTNSPEDDEQPAISPNGTKIAFMEFVNGRPKIRVVTADSATQDITYGSEDTASDYSPAWSPGISILFASDWGSHGPNLDIYVYPPGAPWDYGSVLIRLTDDSLAYDGEPSLSPDTTNVAFTSNRDGNYEVYVMSVDGTDPVNLTQSPASDRYPAWSPDGSKIAFASDRGGSEDIWVMNADGSDPVRLTSSAGSEIFPSWSPDGSKIAFQGDQNGVPDIWVMNADGSNQVDLTNSPARDTHPSWSPVH